MRELWDPEQLHLWYYDKYIWRNRYITTEHNIIIFQFPRNPPRAHVKVHTCDSLIARDLRYRDVSSPDGSISKVRIEHVALRRRDKISCGRNLGRVPDHEPMRARHRRESSSAKLSHRYFYYSGSLRPRSRETRVRARCNAPRNYARNARRPLVASHAAASRRIRGAGLRQWVSYRCIAITIVPWRSSLRPRNRRIEHPPEKLRDWRDASRAGTSPEMRSLRSARATRFPPHHHAETSSISMLSV